MTGIKLAFSNLACPNWELRQTADAVREYGFDGVELRIIDGVPIDSEVIGNKLAAVRTSLDGIQIASLNSSIRLAVDSSAWEDEFRRLTEHCVSLGAPSIRVWGGDFDNSQSVASTVSMVADRLNLAAELASAAGITVALETHDSWRELERVVEVFHQVTEPAARVLWDVQNTHAKGGSTPCQVWEAIGPRIVQVHVKDAKPGPGEYGHLVALGTGAVPAKESIEVLVDNCFAGWITVNWLKFQHPDILAPEVALPQYRKVLADWINAGGGHEV